MSTLPFSEIEFRHIALDTPHGRVEGLFSEMRLDAATIPDGMAAYAIRHGGDDSVPVSIEPGVTVNFFGTLLVAEAPDFGRNNFIEILEWGFDEESAATPQSLTKHLLHE
ncbi:MAG: hypothetical protein LBV18_02095 [Alistipes sp.]|jgi:hypothetical protein|nr:hypothetical protein [Alistipes sp.]